MNDGRPTDQQQLDYLALRTSMLRLIHGKDGDFMLLVIVEVHSFA